MFPLAENQLLAPVLFVLIMLFPPIAGASGDAESAPMDDAGLVLGGVQLLQGLSGPMDGNAQTSLNVTLRYEKAEFFVSGDVGLSQLYHVKQEYCQDEGPCYLGYGVNLNLGIYAYLSPTQISPFFGFSIGGDLGAVGDPFTTGTVSGVFGLEFARHTHIRFFVDARYRAYISSVENGHGPLFSIGVLFR